MLSPDFRFLEPGRGNIGTVITKRNASVCLLINYRHWIQSGGGFDKVSLMFATAGLSIFFLLLCSKNEVAGTHMTLSEFGSTGKILLAKHQRSLNVAVQVKTLCRAVLPVVLRRHVDTRKRVITCRTGGLAGTSAHMY